jgi:RecA/RadA recombinase
MSLLASNFRTHVSKLKDHKMKSETEFDVGYSTGFLSFDFLNGTVIHVRTETKSFSYYSIGITDGSMVMVIGRSGCGKTTFVVQTAANIVRPFKTSCIFHDDIEGGIVIDRKQQLTGLVGRDLTDRYISRNSGITAENFYERIKIVHDLKTQNRPDYEYDTGLYDSIGNRIFKLEPTVYILDSLALLMPEKFTEEDDLSGQMSATATAKTNSAIFKRIIPMLKSANIILFVINHINMKVDINPMQRTKAQVSYLKQGETLPGGNAPIYLSNVMLRFDDNSKIKSTEGFGIDGSLVDVGLVKSRSSKAGKAVTLVFDQDNGYDADLSLLLLLKEHNRLNGAGAYLYIGDRNDYKFSQKNFKALLNDPKKPEFKEIFMNEVVTILKGMINATDLLEEVKEESSLTTSILDKLNTLAA